MPERIITISSKQRLAVETLLAQRQMIDNELTSTVKMLALGADITLDGNVSFRTGVEKKVHHLILTLPDVPKAPTAVVPHDRAPKHHKK